MNLYTFVKEIPHDNQQRDVIDLKESADIKNKSGKHLARGVQG